MFLWGERMGKIAHQNYLKGWQILSLNHLFTLKKKSFYD